MANLPVTSGTPGQQQLPPEIFQMLMAILSTMPDNPAGNTAHRTPTSAVPQFARVPTPTEVQLRQLVSTLNTQNPMNALQGANGALGGRPPGV